MSISKHAFDLHSDDARLEVFEAVVNGETGHERLGQMPAEWVDFLQFRIGGIEHPKLDIAVPSAQVQLTRVFERHAIERYQRFGRDCQSFSSHRPALPLLFLI